MVDKHCQTLYYVLTAYAVLQMENKMIVHKQVVTIGEIVEKFPDAKFSNQMPNSTKFVRCTQSGSYLFDFDQFGIAGTAYNFVEIATILHDLQVANQYFNCI
jgi:hypothetical protein